MYRLPASDIEQAATLLKQGRIVAFPTETVYGLGAPVFDERAIQNIFTMKGRPSDNPLICHICEIPELEQLVSQVPLTARLLIEHFWPGPLTLILNKTPEVPWVVTGGLETVAVRMPHHPLASQLIRAVGQPLVAPSANRSGLPSSTTAEHVLQDFQEMDGAVIDGGPTPGGLESTVIYLSGDQPQLLRPGLIVKEAIEEVLKCRLQIGTPHTKAASPGMRYRHYAPRATIHLVDSFEQASTFNESCFRISTEKHPSFHYMTASTFYALLRRADLEGYPEIVIVCPDLRDEALKDRLFRAAGVGFN